MEEIPFSGWQFCNQRSAGQNGLPSFMLARARWRDFQAPQIEREHSLPHIVNSSSFVCSKSSCGALFFYNFSEAVSWKYDFPETRLPLDLFQNTF
jgi:hypothetical protein